MGLEEGRDRVAVMGAGIDEDLARQAGLGRKMEILVRRRDGGERRGVARQHREKQPVEHRAGLRLLEVALAHGPEAIEMPRDEEGVVGQMRYAATDELARQHWYHV